MESLVASLALLACPIGMGAMIWLMMRGMNQPVKGSTEPDELATLRGEQQRLQAEVDRVRETADGTTRAESLIASR